MKSLHSIRILLGFVVFQSAVSAGISFGRAYCQYPACGSSHASFLSGLYPESTGVVDNNSDIRQTRPSKIAWDEFMRFENDERPAGDWKLFIQDVIQENLIQETRPS